MDVLDAAAFAAWVSRGLRTLGRHEAELNGLNVFPVADNDTGSNMLATWRSVAAAVDEADDGPGGYAGGLPALVGAAAAGALMGARGNSGVILAQFLRGLAGATAATGPLDAGALDAGALDAGALTLALCHAALEAERAMADPVAGTVLDVLQAAAAGAVGDTLVAVTAGAVRSAGDALTRTRERHPVLRRAGVVDAGGRGFVLLLQALHATVAGLEEEPAGRPSGETQQQPQPRTGGPAYEVTYLLEASGVAVAALKRKLRPLGDSLVVAGAEPLWSVHVHVDDVGAAFEAGIEAGRPYRLAATRFHDEPPAERVAVALSDGPGSAALLETMGAIVAGGPDTTVEELVRAIEQSHAAEVVVIAGDPGRQDVVVAAAAMTRTDTRQVAVVPTSSAIQGMVALVVSEPTRRFADDVIAMAQAAAACRCATVTLTAGQALGRIGGEVSETGSDVAEVASALVARLASTGGEILTLLLGEGAPEDLPERLSREHPGLTVEAQLIAPDTPAVTLGLE